MDPIVNGFTFIEVLVSALALFPLLIMVRRKRLRSAIGIMLLVYLLMGIMYLSTASGSVGCYNSGGMTDQYDAPGFFMIIMFVLTFVMSYFTVLCDLILSLIGFIRKKLVL